MGGQGNFLGDTNIGGQYLEGVGGSRNWQEPGTLLLIIPRGGALGGGVVC